MSYPNPRVVSIRMTLFVFVLFAIGTSMMPAASADELPLSNQELASRCVREFCPSVAYQVNSRNPMTVISADVNRDGKLDIATGNVGSHTVSVLIGRGNGTFEPGQARVTGVSPTSLVAGDFNHDAKLDVAGAQGDVFVALGSGDGKFAPPLFFGTTMMGAYALTTADFNHDGKLDIASADHTSSLVSVLFGDGSGSFSSPIHYNAPNAPISIGTADMNGDGNPDLVTANAGSSNLSLFLGTSTGVFQNPTSIGNGLSPNSSHALVLEDMNRDGKVDAVVANEASSSISLFYGDGTGAFGQEITLAAGSHPNALVVADFNRDGKPDLSFTNKDSGSIGVMFSWAHGFLSAVQYQVGETPLSLTPGDFNRDGKIDLATSNFSPFTISVLLSNTH